VRFLVDECLSVELVTVAAEAGDEAHHVAHVGKAGLEGLERPAARLIPNVTVDRQKRLFSRAVDKLAERARFAG
jgi:hypothetical protein